MENLCDGNRKLRRFIFSSDAEFPEAYQFCWWGRRGSWFTGDMLREDRLSLSVGQRLIWEPNFILPCLRYFLQFGMATQWICSWSWAESKRSQSVCGEWLVQNLARIRHASSAWRSREFVALNGTIQVSARGWFFPLRPVPGEVGRLMVYDSLVWLCREAW